MVSAGGVASRQTLLLTTLQACRPPGRQPESSAANSGCAEGRRVAQRNPMGRSGDGSDHHRRGAVDKLGECIVKCSCLPPRLAAAGGGNQRANSQIPSPLGDNSSQQRRIDDGVRYSPSTTTVVTPAGTKAGLLRLAASETLRRLTGASTVWDTLPSPATPWSDG